MAAIHQSHTTLKKIDDLSKIKRRTHQFRHFLNISALYYSTISPLKNPFTNTTLIPQFNKFSNGESQIIFSKNTNNSSINMEVKVMQHSTSFLVPSSEQKPSSLTYALVILNQRLPRFAPLLWEHAKLRVCADGGANRLFDEIPNFFPQLNPADVRNRYKPDVIKGDMDSVRSEVLDFYANLGCDVINESHDQDTTDLHKCILHLSNLTPESEKSNLCVLVTGALGGRFDHEAGNINVLYRFSNLRIILLSDDCLIQLLPRTHHHEIQIQSSVVGPHCGLLPVGERAFHTTTSGLKWNLDDTEMAFGGLLSTSNIVAGDIVSVRSDADLIWTVSIKK